MVISDNLKIIREKNDLSYAELSQLTGIAKSTLQRYETGTTSKIPLDVIVKISHALKVSPEILLGWSNDTINDQKETKKQQLTPKQESLINKIKQADDNITEALEDYLDFLLKKKGKEISKDTIA